MEFCIETNDQVLFLFFIFIIKKTMLDGFFACLHVLNNMKMNTVRDIYTYR